MDVTAHSMDVTAHSMVDAEEPPLSVRDRKLLMQKIQELGDTAHEEIFKMFQERGVEYTRNSNGIFVNLTAVPDDLVRQMRRFVDFCMENKANLDEYDKRLNECKYNQNYEYCMQQQQQQQQLSDPPSLNNAAVATPLCSNGEDEGRGDASADAVGGGPGLDRAAMEKKLEHAKYAAAKKRYAKRKMQDAKKSSAASALDDMTTDELFPEQALLTCLSVA